MRSKVKAFAALTLGAALAIGSLGFATDSQAASQADLEKKIQVLEQSLNALKQQLNEVKTSQEQQQVAQLAAEKKLPKWLDRMTPFGDVRFRYDATTYDDLNGKSKDSRDRFRVRFRFGVKSQIHEDVQLGFRLATGSDDDPTSTNQTMGNFWGEYTSLGIDMVWLTWTPSFVPDKGLDFTFGKAKNPFLTTRVMWDGDVNPEGSWLKYTFNKKGTIQPYVLGAWFYLKEHSSDPPDDLYAWAGQIGVKGKAGKFKYDLGTSYYSWGKLGEAGQLPPNIHGNPVYTENGEDRISTFGVWDLVAKASYKFSAKGSISAWGHYLTNQDAEGPHDDKDTGYAFGAKVQYDKFSLGAWYKYIEANATPGFISDSDSAYVNRKGYIIEAGYQFWKYGTVALKYFDTKAIEEDIDGASNGSKTFFADFVFKF